MDWSDVPVAELGTTYFTVLVGDNDGANDTHTMAVTVEDSSPPVITVPDLATDCLWPPNNKMFLFELGEDVIAQATDSCAGAVSVEVVSVSSNQPDNGCGSGSASPDVVFGAGAFCLRAERAGGNKLGREYTVLLAATDAAGNTTTHPVIIRVPHSKKNQQQCATPSSLEVVLPNDPRCSAGLAP